MLLFTLFFAYFFRPSRRERLYKGKHKEREGREGRRLILFFSCGINALRKYRVLKTSSPLVILFFRSVQSVIPDTTKRSSKRTITLPANLSLETIIPPPGWLIDIVTITATRQPRRFIYRTPFQPFHELFVRWKHSSRSNLIALYNYRFIACLISTFLRNTLYNPLY